MKESENIKYKFLKNRKYSLRNYSIVPLRNDDIVKIKTWRNEQINILRQKDLLSNSQQKEYYHSLIENSFYIIKPSEILFSFLLNDECIGYGGLVHIDWMKKIGEISFINDTTRASNDELYRSDFKNFISLLFGITFSELKFSKVTTETYGIRTNTLRLLDELGFKLNHVIENNIQINNKKYNSFFHEYSNNK
tara:strand:+ start:1846 stop:2424 length:579 start_codon:yes stop_codon:yes gene_type:complete